VDPTKENQFIQRGGTLKMNSILFYGLFPGYPDSIFEFIFDDIPQDQESLLKSHNISGTHGNMSISKSRAPTEY
jgi:hypothetical protein